jgi:hypothetical protein
MLGTLKSTRQENFMFCFKTAIMVDFCVLLSKLYMEINFKLTFFSSEKHSLDCLGHHQSKNTVVKRCVTQ